jgi:hypothetical protein
MSHELDLILKIAGATEGAEVRSFEIARPATSESPFQRQQRLLRVDVADSGAGPHRYMVTVTEQDGPDRRPRVGHPDADLKSALMNVHWHEFD